MTVPPIPAVNTGDQFPWMRPIVVADRAYDPDPAFLSAAREHLDHKFQPLVTLQSGRCFGFEAVLQGWEACGFPDRRSLFDHALASGCLNRLDRLLRRRAARAFARLPLRDVRLFYTVDVRMGLASDAPSDLTGQFLRDFGDNGITPASLCVEMIDNGPLSAHPAVTAFIQGIRRDAGMVAIDDFGCGGSGLRLLYDHQPNFLKVDRFFVSGLDHDQRKRLSLATIVQLAHTLGVVVIAEGVETERELAVARELGCDMAQGRFFSPPLPPDHGFPSSFPSILEISRRDRRHPKTDRQRMMDEIERVPPLTVGSTMATVFQTFRANKEQNFFPILDRHERPLGIIREADLKDFIYSRYGKDLLNNKFLHRGLLDFVTPCPVSEIDTGAEILLEIYAQASAPHGIIIVEEMRYVGILSAASLLRILNEKTLASARDQNPLTQLPGNNAITDHLGAALALTTTNWLFFYFDIDNFKPFNDTYGFRQGDRLIALLAQLLRRSFTGAHAFVGHIGGDDFFVSLSNVPFTHAVTQVMETLERFRADAESFYEPAVRERGYITAKDRFGELRQFPLLSCSAAVVEIPAGDHTVTIDAVGAAIAELKKAAKQAPSRLCSFTFIADTGRHAA